MENLEKVYQDVLKIMAELTKDSPATFEMDPPSEPSESSASECSGQSQI